MSHDYLEKLYEQYSSQREKLDAASIEAAGRYDKAVLTISTGALALSVAFIDKIASCPQSWTLFILVPGWFLLLISIITQLLALSSSHNATREQICILDQEYTRYFQADDPATLVKEGWTESEPVNKYVDITNKFNLVSQIALILGIVCILAFSSVNICQKKEMPMTDKKPTPPKDKSESSYTPPVNKLPPPPPKKEK
jgi:carbon starvation protein CstA